MVVMLVCSMWLVFLRFWGQKKQKVKRADKPDLDYMDRVGTGPLGGNRAEGVIAVVAK